MKWRWDYKGFGALLCGPEMQGLMEGRADKVAAAARGISPTDDGVPDGHYRDKFEVESGVMETLTGRRAYGRVTNTSPHAAAVEWGNRRAPAQHVLGRAIDHIRET
jgi:hypothetical protein